MCNSDADWFPPVAGLPLETPAEYPGFAYSPSQLRIVGFSGEATIFVGGSSVQDKFLRNCLAWHPSWIRFPARSPLVAGGPGFVAELWVPCPFRRGGKGGAFDLVLKTCMTAGGLLFHGTEVTALRIFGWSILRFRRVRGFELPHATKSSLQSRNLPALAAASAAGC